MTAVKPSKSDDTAFWRLIVRHVQALAAAEADPVKRRSFVAIAAVDRGRYPELSSDYSESLIS